MNKLQKVTAITGSKSYDRNRKLIEIASDLIDEDPEQTVIFVSQFVKLQEVIKQIETKSKFINLYIIHPVDETVVFISRHNKGASTIDLADFIKDEVTGNEEINLFFDSPNMDKHERVAHWFKNNNNVTNVWFNCLEKKLYFAYRALFLMKPDSRFSVESID